MYTYPDNLKSKATLWLWELKDIAIIGVGLLISVLALTQVRFMAPLAVTLVYAFLAIRFADMSILNFIQNACRFFLLKRQLFYWGYTSEWKK